MSDLFPSTTNTDQSALALRLAEAQVAAPASGGVEFLNMNQQGHWSYGRTGTECTGDTAVVDSGSFQHGWIIWANSKPTRVAAEFYDAMPQRPNAIDGNEPAEMRSVKMLMQGEGVVVQFEKSSYGGRAAIDTLLAAIKSRSASGNTFVYPVVELESTSYTSKQGSKIFNPVFTVTSWVNAQGVVEGQEELEVLDAEVEEAPAPRTRKAK